MLLYNNMNFFPLHTKFNIIILLSCMFLQVQEKGDALKTLEIIGHHDKLVDHLVQHPQFLDFLPSIFPFNNKIRISSDFEHRIHPLTKAAQFHAGIDFPLEKGTSVMATGHARVYKVEYYNPISGNCVILSHLGGWESIYCHLSEIHIQAGELVQQGQRIGKSGASGAVTGPHLHYAIKKKQSHWDPLRFCVLKREVKKIIKNQTRTRLFKVCNMYNNLLY